MTDQHGDCASYCRRCEEEQERALLGTYRHAPVPSPLAALQARVTELESKLAACAASCESEAGKARTAAIEECRAIAVRVVSDATQQLKRERGGPSAREIDVAFAGHIVGAEEVAAAIGSLLKRGGA